MKGLTGMATINSVEDLIRAVDENPEWLEALRARILTRELLEMPERLAQLTADVHALTARVDALAVRMDELTARVDALAVSLDALTARVDDLAAKMDELVVTSAKMDARIDRLEGRVTRIEHDIGQLRAGHARSMAERFAPLIAGELGLRYTRRLDTAELVNIARDADTSSIPTNELRSFMRADVVIEAVGEQDSDAHYIAVEVSYTADRRDSHRATRNARYLAEFIGGAHTHAVVASYRYDNEVANLIQLGTLGWFELTASDTEVNGE